ncbi:hypothetical protein JUN65_05820 [Gluconacetobacter azotocaptans]|uniref:hypothetical protein n=1 Tax=Gluconacetobacter azotocaptans TaxID=142834 RepID=UPI00195DEB74|nr:hypothetical protein [Gluconacetobacter azotocaptans]MBM9401098.1 hypothetical protein [Gluconacetobacter azotocaptans]
MLVLGLALSLCGLGFFCWLLFMAAVYALPVFVGAMVFAHGYHAGSGAGSLLLGALAGIATAAIGRFILATSAEPALRAVVVFVFAVPALVMGYCMTLGFAQIGTGSFLLSHLLAVIGAAVAGGTVWVRLSAIGPP